MCSYNHMLPSGTTRQTCCAFPTLGGGGVVTSGEHGGGATVNGAIPESRDGD